MFDQDFFRVLFTASAFGSILFFAIVVAPTVSKSLEGQEAAEFLRRVIPRYFFFLIVVAGLGAFSSWEHQAQAFGLAFVAVSSIFVRQITLPELFVLRDMQMDGDTSAGQRFIRTRRIVLGLTGVQLLITAGVLARIAS